MTPRHRPPANVMDLLLDAVCIVDADGRFVSVSAAGEHIFGYTPEEMIGKPMIELVFHEDRERTLQAAEQIVAGHPQHHFENRYVRKDGQIVHIMWSARWSPADRARIAVARDVTRRKRAESMQAALYAISEAAHGAKDLLALFQQIHQIIGALLPALNFFVALYDEANNELSFPYYVDQYERSPFPQELDPAALSEEIIRTGKALRLTPETIAFLPGHARSDIGRNALNWLGVPLRASKGVIGALVLRSYSPTLCYTEQDTELLQFVSAQVATAIERKQMEIWLQHIARHDPLTDLPNRELFHHRLESALALARRNQDRLAVLYLDLDKFKQVNDTLGHDIGDLLLQEVAQRLRQCVRESDTVGRVGGDEFLVLLPGIQLPQDALLVAEKIRQSLCRPFCLAGHHLHMSSSIGVALYPEHGSDHKQLIRHADEAMYGAKKHGGDQFQMTSGAGI